MKILAADDEQIMLEALTESIKTVVPEAEVHAFRKSSELLEFAHKELCDIAFLDIHMAGINGIALAKMLKDISPQMNIIFVTGYSEYMGMALGMHVSGYIMKPVTAKLIEEEMNYLRYPIKMISQHKLRVQTFGNFEVFYEEVPLKFERAKTKELFAYLVDRKGCAMSMAELCVALWGNDEDIKKQSSNLRNLISDLKKTLKKIGQEHILFKSHNSLAIIPNTFDCDYYKFLQADIEAVNSYTSEYMSQYSWAEMTLGALENTNNILQIKKN